MRAVKIREISSRLFEEAAERNEPLAITHDHVVCGVLIPVSPDWVREVIDTNLSRIVHSVQIGERELVAGGAFTTLDDALAERAEVGAAPPLRRVGIRQVSGKLIREAAERDEPLAITSDNVLRGVVIPVSPRWLEEVVYSNLSRIVHSVQVGEREVSSGQPFVTLDHAVAEDDRLPANVPSSVRTGKAAPSPRLARPAAASR